ncbi:metal ABC transporter ATP-binding protein [Cyanobium sp. Aljojuca 7D2]|uniref:metal ABC transporter ATP-binding protein n=1 Tax=Cyanobium sp. Aljojuca 7D2 TaxID=2823698 RepID=UPI0020CE7930|nr:metal ABC transporter ATP-binding protein [Cyanobium sp. Aljojuca 7D2]MCP9891775.1 metal ABC transporter ATP-binding protein [Cyanobium sp. Aljojuca 7D2]
MTDSAPVLSVEGLSVRRGEQLAVEQVSFQLARETDTALVGPNGAGKSSLVAALLGLLPRAAGAVRILGHSLGPAGELPRAVRAQIAYLPQSLALQGRFPLTVGEFVGFGADAPGLSLAWLGRARRTAAMRRALQRTGCQDLVERRLSELSGGQLKRVLLAFCVVRPRQLLVLDEAQAGLDAPSSEQFQELLLDLRRQEGWTVLQVSHDLEMVRRSCDQVLCLNRHLRCSGAPDHALSPARLAELYGPNVVPYRHNHAGIAGHG